MTLSLNLCTIMQYILYIFVDQILSVSFCNLDHYIWTSRPDPRFRKHTPRRRVWSQPFGHRDVVTGSVLDSGMLLLTFLVWNQQRHPSVQTAEIRLAKRGVCFLIPGSGVLFHIYSPCWRAPLTTGSIFSLVYRSRFTRKGRKFQPQCTLAELKTLSNKSFRYLGVEQS